jgi:hypothetical protein
MKAIEGTTSEACKDLWKTVRSRLGWSTNPPPESLAVDIAERLKNDQSLASELAELLQSRPTQAGDASLLVGRLKAGKVVLASVINVSGDLNM